MSGGSVSEVVHTRRWPRELPSTLTFSPSPAEPLVSTCDRTRVESGCPGDFGEWLG